MIPFVNRTFIATNAILWMVALIGMTAVAAYQYSKGGVWELAAAAASLPIIAIYCFASGTTLVLSGARKFIQTWEGKL